MARREWYVMAKQRKTKRSLSGYMVVEVWVQSVIMFKSEQKWIVSRHYSEGAARRKAEEVASDWGLKLEVAP